MCHLTAKKNLNCGYQAADDKPRFANALDRVFGRCAAGDIMRIGAKRLAARSRQDERTRTAGSRRTGIRT